MIRNRPNAPGEALSRLVRSSVRALAGVRGFLLKRPPGFLVSAGFLAVGAALYLPASALNRFLAERFSPPPVLSVLPEEALKLGLALGAAALARRLRNPGLGLAVVPGATGFAAAENLAYMAAFPDAGVFLRLGWALPLHVNAAALFALALASPRPAAAAAGAFAVSAAVHAAFNAAAVTHPSPPMLLGGIVFNLALCAALAFLTRRRFAWGGILYGKSRA